MPAADPQTALGDVVGFVVLVDAEEEEKECGVLVGGGDEERGEGKSGDLQKGGREAGREGGREGEGRYMVHVSVDARPIVLKRKEMTRGVATGFVSPAGGRKGGKEGGREGGREGGIHLPYLEIGSQGLGSEEELLSKNAAVRKIILHLFCTMEREREGGREERHERLDEYTSLPFVPSLPLVLPASLQPTHR